MYCPYLLLFYYKKIHQTNFNISPHLYCLSNQSPESYEVLTTLLCTTSWIDLCSCLDWRGQRKCDRYSFGLVERDKRSLRFLWLFDVEFWNNFVTSTNNHNLSDTLAHSKPHISFIFVTKGPQISWDLYVLGTTPWGPARHLANQKITFYRFYRLKLHSIGWVTPSHIVSLTFLFFVTKGR